MTNYPVCKGIISETMKWGSTISWICTFTRDDIGGDWHTGWGGRSNTLSWRYQVIAYAWPPFQGQKSSGFLPFPRQMIIFWRPEGGWNHVFFNRSYESSCSHSLQPGLFAEKCCLLQRRSRGSGSHLNKKSLQTHLLHHPEKPLQKKLAFLELQNWASKRDLISENLRSFLRFRQKLLKFDSWKSKKKSKNVPQPSKWTCHRFVVVENNWKN